MKQLVIADTLHVLPQQSRLLHEIHRGVGEEGTLDAEIVCDKKSQSGCP